MNLEMAFYPYFIYFNTRFTCHYITNSSYTLHFSDTYGDYHTGNLPLAQSIS